VGGISRKLRGIQASSLSIFLTISGIVILSASSTQITQNYFTYYFFQYTGEDVLVLNVNGTVDEVVSTLEAYQLVIENVTIEGGPVSIIVRAENHEMLRLQSVSNQVFDGIAYPGGVTDRYPSFRTFYITAYYEDYNATITILYKTGAIDPRYHGHAWETFLTPWYYPLVFTGLIMLSLGGINFMIGVIQAAKLSIRPQKRLFLSMLLAPQFLLLDLFQSWFQILFLSSIWSYRYPSVLPPYSIPLLVSTFFSVRFFLGTTMETGVLLSFSTIIFPGVISLLSIFAFVERRIRKRVVYTILIANLCVNAFLWLMFLNDTSRIGRLTTIPIPLFAWVGLYLVRRWKENGKQYRYFMQK
jgi:hypothetical protein